MGPYRTNAAPAVHKKRWRCKLGFHSWGDWQLAKLPDIYRFLFETPLFERKECVHCGTLKSRFQIPVSNNTDIQATCALDASLPDFLFFFDVQKPKAVMDQSLDHGRE